MRAVIAEGGRSRLVERPTPSPGPGQVRIRVAGAGLNRADLLQCLGRYAPPAGVTDVLGLEASGVVDAIGEGVASVWLGRSVIALLRGGGMADWVVCDVREVAPAPSHLALAEAGAWPEAWVTAHLHLVTLGRVAAGERALVFGGAGGVGSAAIHILLRRGASVVATAAGPERCAYVSQLGAQPIDRLARYWTESLDALWPDGLDLALDTVGGEATGALVDRLRPDGRVAVVGLLGGARATVDGARIIYRRLTLFGHGLRGLTEAARGTALAAAMADIASLATFATRSLPLESVQDGLDQMRAGTIVGKLWLDVTTSQRHQTSA